MEVADGLQFYPERCIGCGECEPVCPTNVIEFSTGGITFDNGIYVPTDAFIGFRGENCVNCGECTFICPTKALEGDWGLFPGSEPGEGDGGGGGSDAGSGNPPTDPVGPPIINSDLTDPCSAQAFETAFGNGQQNVILSEFAELLGTSDGFDVTFYQSNNPNSDDWAQTQMFSAGEGPDANYYFYITLNTSVIRNTACQYASQEALVATMYHEIVHVILETKKIVTGSELAWDEPLQHEVMGAAYIDKMTTVMMGIFPNLTQADAEALAWEGLQNTNYWQQWSSLHPVEANDILLRGDHFDADGTGGTRCSPPSGPCGN